MWRAAVWVVSSVLLSGAGAGCGPTVGFPDAGSTGREDTEVSGSPDPGTSDAPTSGGPVTTAPPPPPPPPTSSGPDPATGDVTTGPPLPACLPEDFDGLAVLVYNTDDPVTFETACVVQTLSPSLDSVTITLACGPPNQGTFDLIAGGSWPAQDLFPEGRSVTMLADVQPEPDGWYYLALYDGEGELIAGQYDMNPDGPAPLHWFGDGTSYEFVETECELIEDPESCPQRRVAVDFTIGGATARVYDSGVANIGAFRVVMNGARWFETNPEFPWCPDVARYDGAFFVHAL